MKFVHSALTLILGLSVLYIAGLPLTWLTWKGKSALRDVNSLSALALFTGYAVITIPLQLLYAVGLPVQYTAWPILVLTLGGFVFFVYQKIRQKALRSLLPSRLYLLILVCITALVSLSYFKIGDTFYKGYNWWDNFFYGTQAELLKSVSYPSVHEYVAAHPFAAYSGYYLTHRIARGVFQAYISTISFVDCASTLGMIGILTTPLVFSALLFATKDIEMRKAFRYAACGFAALIPILISLQLEGFVAVAQFVCSMTLLCKLLPEALNNPNWKKSLLTSAIIASLYSSFAEAVYLILAFLLLALGLSLLSRPKNGASIVHAIGISGGILVFNLPYMPKILEALRNSLEARGQDGVYPFAKSVGFFTSTYFGNDLSAVESTLYYRILVAFSILLFLAGLFGLVQLCLQKHPQESFLFLALSLSPLFFLSKITPEIYFIYKTFALSVPLLVFGVWYLADLCYTQLSTGFLISWTTRSARSIRAVVSKGLFVFLAAVFSFSSYCSVRNVLEITNHALAVNANRDWNYYLADDIVVFDEIRALTGKNILLIGNTYNLSFWWLTYYGRNNNIYALRDDAFSIYAVPSGNDYSKSTSLANIPLDSILFIAPGVANLVTDPVKAQDYAAQLVAGETPQANAAGGVMLQYPYDLRVFARDSAIISVCVDIQREKLATLALLVVPEQGKAQSLHLEAGESVLTFSVPLHPGAQSIRILLESEDASANIANCNAEIIYETNG